MILAPLSLLAPPASAGPALHTYQALAVAGWPGGVLSDTQVGARWELSPGSRSILFEDTFVDLGGRASVSPAFVELGPKVVFAPIAVFDLALQATVIRYVSPRFGPMGYDGLLGTLDSARTDRWRAGFGFTGWGTTLQASPTFKGRVGPSVFVSSWNVSRVSVAAPEGIDSPYVFEPYRGMVIEWTDTTVEHLSAVMWEPYDGSDGPMLRLGGALRGKYADRSPEAILTAGFVGMGRPGDNPNVPQFTAIVLPYVLDPERVGRAPFVAVLAEWDVTRR
ncbi:MAG: hypothetical protein ABMA64_12700 [Myxococcota bacterium]